MEVDRRAFIATVGVGALSAMSPEDKAEELEHYMIDMLDGGPLAGCQLVRLGHLACESSFKRVAD